MAVHLCQTLGVEKIYHQHFNHERLFPVEVIAVMHAKMIAVAQLCLMFGMMVSLGKAMCATRVIEDDPACL